jgi:putative transposase
MNELKNRGVGNILIAVVDGLKGFPDARTRFSRRRSGRHACISFEMDFASLEGPKSLRRRAEENLSGQRRRRRLKGVR